MWVLFDQATPVLIRPFLVGHTVSTASREDGTGSETVSCSAPLKPRCLSAEPRHRKITIIVFGKQQWAELRPHVPLVVAAVNVARPGAYVELAIPEET